MAFLEHLYNKHFLHLGKPENLVFIDELLDTVQQKLESLICLYCERVFKDRTTLKEHMRKKGHKRINPENKLYDKYFLVNYKMDKNSPKTHNHAPRNSKPDHGRYKASSNTDTESRKKRPEISKVFQTDNSDSDWSEWEANAEEATAITCLFCDTNSVKIEVLKHHMIEAHNYDFDLLVEKLNFYHRVKMVNYTRRQIMYNKCPNSCDIEFENYDDLFKHMEKEKHFAIQDNRLYNQPQYFFPTIDGKFFFIRIKIIVFY